MEIRQDLIESSKYSLKCPYEMTPDFIIVHNTANDAPAKNEVSYMKNNSSSTSFHIAVDDVEAVQGIPFNRNTWNCGDGTNGKGNRNGISIEICYSKSGGERWQKAKSNAIEVIVQILKQYGWGIEQVKKHQDFNGKYCPHRILDEGWNKFLNEIKAKLDGRKPTPISEKIKEDGYWGKDTTRKAQKVFGTPIDGIVSNQYASYKAENPGLLSSTFEWKSNPSKNGSVLIKAIQKKIGVRQDGKIGPDTIKGMQRWLGTPVDGKVSYPSEMVKAFQRWLNKQ